MAWPYRRPKRRVNTRRLPTGANPTAPPVVITSIAGLSTSGKVASVVFDQPVNQNIVGVPSGWFVNGHPITGINVTSATNAELLSAGVTGSGTVTTYNLPSTLAVQSLAGAPTAPKISLV